MSDQADQRESIERPRGDGQQESVEGPPTGDPSEFIGEEIAMRDTAGGFEGEHGERVEARGGDDAGPM